MRDADKFSVYFSAQGVQRDSYYGANQDLSAYGETQDFSWSSGVLYIRHSTACCFHRLPLRRGPSTTGACWKIRNWVISMWSTTLISGIHR
jgi:outer membrane receptor for ferrienterochelin and colicins